MLQHHVTSSTKVYLRHREGYPETGLLASAFEGFKTLGAEIVPFEWVDDIDSFEDLGPETMIAGYIGDIWRGLQKMGKDIPEPLDYPESLTKYLGRDIIKTCIGSVRNSDERMFVKPVQQKLFTGFVWEGRKDLVSRRRILLMDDSIEVLSCQPINMLSEYRAMILQGEILDVRRYKGDWSLSPDRDTVESAVKDFEASGEAPAAYTLDFAVSDDRTVLVEANDGYAFGNYGLRSEAYASCLAARWKQMAQ